MLQGFWREHVTKRLERSPQWSKTRNAMVKRYPSCAACNSKKELQVHHIVPFSIDPSLELDEENLVVLCSRCHLLMGHLGSYHSWNPGILHDAAYLKLKIKHRPHRDKDSKKKSPSGRNIWGTKIHS